MLAKDTHLTTKDDHLTTKDKHLTANDVHHTTKDVHHAGKDFNTNVIRTGQSWKGGYQELCNKLIFAVLHPLLYKGWSPESTL